MHLRCAQMMLTAQGICSSAKRPSPWTLVTARIADSIFTHCLRMHICLQTTYHACNSRSYLACCSARACVDMSSEVPMYLLKRPGLARSNSTFG
jgi:hypothetical protein